MTCDVHLTVRRCMCFIVSARAVARNFTWGEVHYGGGKTSVIRPRAGMGKIFGIFALKWCILVNS